MNQPNPAIVAQNAVRRLPRLALALFCAAYVLPGFLGRLPWKSADVTAFGYMRQLALGGMDGAVSWFYPTLLGQPPEIDALLPYWLGAWAQQLLSPWLDPAFAARLPFIALLLLTFAATWYGVYYLAQNPKAQPVAFAFGGEAQPRDYARALADGGLLALIACLGLAQLSHETTPAQAQICFCALSFYAVAALPWHRLVPAIGLVCGLFGLALSGAPAMAVLFGLGSTLLCLAQPEPQALRRAAFVGAVTLATAWLAWHLDLWRWRVGAPALRWMDVHALGRLLLWFTWPAWPLSLWTLWRWRRQLLRRDIALHMGLPVWYVLVTLGTTVLTQASDRSLLLGLPAMATLAAFALPTLKRTVSSLIDWFTLIFFTGCAFVIWLFWIAMQTGIPPQAAANVARRAPGFVAEFSVLPFLVALAATLAWAWLVRWRVGRHRAAIWKSVILPAGGAALSWLLLMTLWLPLLDYARSYAPMARQIQQITGTSGCVTEYGLTRGQIAAFQYHAGLRLEPATRQSACAWLMVDGYATDSLGQAVDLTLWTLKTTVRRPADNAENVLLYQRTTP
jgi:4-amino-4-deoxy-L-arabinose transferase-like glycosyltransferase